MDLKHEKAPIGEPLQEDTERPEEWPDPFERWMELADWLLREKMDPQGLRH